MFRLLCIASVLLLLLGMGAGCAKKPMVETEVTPPPPPPVAETISIPVKTETKSEPVAPISVEEIISSDSMSLAAVLFEYDSYDLTESAQQFLQKNLAWFMKNPGVKIALEGHCDERGSDEYNLALGERRALAIKNYLVQNGVASEHFSIISYGEEKPVRVGHDEAAWQLNRRVEFK